MDVAIFYPGTQIVQDRYYYLFGENTTHGSFLLSRFARGRSTPALDTQQDFCLIRTNLSDQNVYVTFERFVITGDTNDIGFNTNVFLTFAVGPYTAVPATNTFNPQYHLFRIALQTSISLLSCISSKIFQVPTYEHAEMDSISAGCLTTSCTTSACPCVQQVSTGTGQCLCFPASPCISGSTITPRTTVLTPTTPAMPSFIPSANNGAYIRDLDEQL